MKLVSLFVCCFLCCVSFAQKNSTLYGYTDSVNIRNASSSPTFIDGDHGWQIFLEKNLVYPKDARKQKIEGTVITEFTVGADGFASNIEIVKSVYPSLDAEAIKLIHRSAWIPAVNAYGQAVKYRMRQPIEFHL